MKIDRSRFGWRVDCYSKRCQAKLGNMYLSCGESKYYYVKLPIIKIEFNRKTNVLLIEPKKAGSKDRLRLNECLQMFPPIIQIKIARQHIYQSTSLTTFPTLLLGLSRSISQTRCRRLSSSRSNTFCCSAGVRRICAAHWINNCQQPSQRTAAASDGKCTMTTATPPKQQSTL